MPQSSGRFPAILKRTPYPEHVLGWKPENLKSYLDAGYGVIYQMIRGTGASEGQFNFNSRTEGSDGYDAVEWIAGQPWCSGAVGMDGSSYLGMTQLWAASERPPHLRCIVPAAPVISPFHVAPYWGGAFGRQHTINWCRLISISALSELKGGFLSARPILAQVDWLERMTSRPVIDAANDILQGDRLQYYRAALQHPVLGKWWKDRALQAGDFAKIDIPVLLVTGNFDDSASETLRGWRALEQNASAEADRHLIIGPWDHGQTYAGGGETYGPYDFADKADLDIQVTRLAFFDRHLKESGGGPTLANRATVYVTGSNEWRSFATFPPAEVAGRSLYLHSAGAANSVRGDGQLTWDPPSQQEQSDSFVSDPALPFVPAFASADPTLEFDVRELERCHERLVYSTEPLEAPLTILGEPRATLYVATDTPDCDVVTTLAEERADGTRVRLALGVLRLRYREGFDRETLMSPGACVEVKIDLMYVGHEVAVGSRLRLIVGADLFPYIDPNPNTGEPIATAVDMRIAVETIFHDVERPSSLLLPVLDSTS
jgi:hypothetical protein